MAGLREIESQNYRVGRDVKDYLVYLPILLVGKLRPRDTVLFKSIQVVEQFPDSPCSPASWDLGLLMLWSLGV